VHRRVGAFVEAREGESASERPGFLAHHFFQGQAWREALAYSLVAGHKAKREYANEASVAHFDRALQAAAELEPLEEDLEAHEALGEVLTIVGRYDEALDHLEEARAQVETLSASVGRDRRLADLFRKTADVYEAKGEYETALAWLGRGLALPGVENQVEEAYLRFRGTAVYYRQGNNELAAEWCQLGLAAADKLSGQTRQEVLARGNYQLGGILVRRGDLDGAISRCQQSLQLYEELGDLFGQSQAHTNLALTYYHQDSWDLSARHHISAMDIAKQIGYAEGQARAASNLGGIYLVQGKADAALEQYRVALDIVERLGMVYGVALMHNNLGAVCLQGAEWDEAVGHLEQSLALFEDIGSEEFLAELFRYRAEAALGQGLTSQALDRAERSLNYAQTHSMRLEEGITWRVLGRVHRERGELKQAEEALTQALEIAQEAHKRHEIALTQLELARLRIEQGEEKVGGELARQAAQVLGELGARLDLEDAESLSESIA
jgi:tetratricopeptide (TPR) repeat protein